MKCLEVRDTPMAIKRRRYALKDGRRVTTYEIPEAVVSYMGRKRLEELMASWRRGEEKRSKAIAIKSFVEQHQDWKPTALAYHLGVSDQRVRQILKELRAPAFPLEGV